MTVKKRHVYYISGFDPRGAAFYRRLYQTEAAKQSAVGGITLQIGARRRVTSFASSWSIQAHIDGQAVLTTYEYLQWDDLIRAHWSRNEVAILRNYLKAAWIYLRSGTLERILQASWPPFVTSLFPLAILLALIALASGGMLACVRLLSGWAGWLAGAVCFAGVLQAGRVLEKRMNSYWLLRIYAFSAQQGLGQLSDLEARLDKFAEHIVSQINAAVKAGDIPDEILIVGHSTGTIMASSVVGRVLVLLKTDLPPDMALNAAANTQQQYRISLLTLGQCIPIVSMLPQAQRYRDDLARINQSGIVDWVDFTAPSDGACFALVDPIGVSGLVQANAHDPKPKLLSPRFARLFSPASYAGIKRNWYRQHFQYIMASERADEYDYFAITAGAATLRARHQSQPSVQHYQRPSPF